MTNDEYKRLCSAVLIQALDDITKGGEDGLDALAWTYNTKDNYVFDFIVICRVLCLDPAGVKAVIRTNKVKSFLDKYKSIKLSQRTLTHLPKSNEHSKPAKPAIYQKSRAA